MSAGPGSWYLVPGVPVQRREAQWGRGVGKATPRVQKKSESGVDAEEFSKPRERDEFKST